MRRPGRKLTAQEAALWAKVASTVEPLGQSGYPQAVRETPPPGAGGELAPEPVARRLRRSAPVPPPPAAGTEGRARPFDRSTLDATWDRKLAKGMVGPDFTLDLHGATLDAAHARLDHGLTLALAQGARLVLLITGRARPVDAADRGSQRGAIRRKFMDWLANGSHASKIAAIRPAHPRHGGAGAVYIVLRRPR